MTLLIPRLLLGLVFSLRQEKDPDGGPYPAYPSGKTWDEPSGKTGSGKKFPVRSCLKLLLLFMCWDVPPS